MERKEIKLNSLEHLDLCAEHYLTIHGKEVPIKIVEDKYESGSRHTEIWEMVFMIVESEEYYSIGYETSVKDSMGWSECNWADEYTATQVFPETKTITIYK